MFIRNRMYNLEKIEDEVFPTYSYEHLEKISMESSLLVTSIALNKRPDMKMILKPDNKYYRLCDFHPERTASLIIFENEGIYKCHGCHSFGSIFKYVMECDEDITCFTAIETIAKAFKVSLPRNTADSVREDIVEKILKTLESDYYKELLIKRKQKDKKITRRRERRALILKNKKIDYYAQL